MLPVISHSNVKYAKKGTSPNKNEDNYKMEAMKQKTNNVPGRLETNFNLEVCVIVFLEA